MFRLFLLTILIALFSFSSLHSNDYFYFSPKGQESLELSHTKILIQFIDGTSLVAQREILNPHKSVLPLKSTSLLPSPQVTYADLININSDAEVESLLKTLRTYPRIKYAYPVFDYTDGTKMGLQAKLLIRLKNKDHYPILENITLRYGLTIEKENEFDALLFHITIPDANLDPLRITQELFKSQLFDYVEPDFLRFLKPMSTNDPALGDQWALNNTGQNGTVVGTAGADMNVFDAWRTTTGKATIKIAIIDEGVDLNHPDLIANILPGYDATEQNSGGAPSGDDAHGTACAGIAAAVGNNNLGMAGVAYDCKIIPVRLAYTNGDNWVTSSAWVSNALNWSWKDAGADVISNSWGGGGSSFSINNAIDSCVIAGRNGLGAPTLFAAGNDNTDVSYPADYASGVAVGAISMCYERKTPTSCDGETWWGSNFGTNLDVVAPGSRIYATDISGAAGYSEVDYTPGFNGTSAATPNAAGVVALLLSADESLTEEEVRYALESTCRKVGNYTYNDGVAGQPTGSWNNEMGYGLVDASAAIQAVAPSQNDDAGIMEITSPVATVCGSTIQTIVKLRNNGSNALTSAKIHIRISGVEMSTYQWNGNLASTIVTDVVLPDVSVSSAAHTIEVYTSEPNGQTDSNPANDRAFSTFSIGEEEFLLRVFLDNYGSETSWDIVDEQQSIILNGGPYTDNNVGQQNDKNFCLPAGCYTLTFYDLYDDGMCCGYGDGSFELTQLSNGTVLATGGQYTDRSIHPFCIEDKAPEPLVATVENIAAVRCNGGSDGVATVTATGGITPYTYLWSNGSTQATVNNLTVGSHQVTVEDADNQQVIKNIITEEPDAILISSTTQNALDNKNGSATATATGGKAPYIYRWSNGGTTQTINNLSGGNYTVTVTDQNDCNVIENIIVDNENTPPLQVTITNITAVLCNGEATGSAQAEVSGGFPPYYYQWSNGSPAGQVNNLLAGTQSVTVTDDKNQTVIKSILIEEPTSLFIESTTQNALDNKNGSAAVSVTGGIAPYIYQWSTGSASQAIDGLSSGIYSVTVYDQNQCSRVASVIVGNDETPPLQSSIINIVPVLCNGEATGGAQVEVSGGFPPYSYQWSNGNTSAIASSLSGGIQNVTVTDSENQIVVKDVFIAEPAPLFVETTSQNALDNENGSATANASGGTAPYNYQWSNDATTSTIDGLSSGEYSVTVYDQNQCSKVSVVTVSNDETPPLQLVITNVVSIRCNGESTGSARATASGGFPPYNYQWSHEINESSTGPNSSTNFSSVNNLASGLQSVTVTDSKMQAVIKDVFIAEPAPILIETNSQNALDNENGVATIEATGGVAPYIYQWSTGGDSKTIDGLNSGIYSVTIYDQNQCSAVASVTVGNDDTPALVAIITNVIPVLCNGEAMGGAQVEVSGGFPPYSYQWSNEEATAITNNLSAGMQSVTITDSEEQQVIKEVFIEQPTPLLVETSSQNALDNEDGTASLEVTGGTAPYIYQWSTGGSTKTIDGLNSGEYSVTVYDQNQCSTISTVTVGNNETPALAATITNVIPVFCNGEAMGGAQVEVSGGFPPYSYQWSNEETAAIANNLSAGMQSVTITDSKEQQVIKEIFIEQPTLLSAETSSQNALDNENGIATVAATGGVAPYIYQWSTDGSTKTIDGLNSGEYSVTVYDQNQCSTISTVIVGNNETPALTAIITNVIPVRCNGETTGGAQVEVSGGFPPYSYQWSNEETAAIANTLSAGTQSVTITDSEEQQVIKVVFIESPAPILLEATSQNAVDNDIGTATAAATGGVAPYIYQW
ncbi:MAG: S8 family serine peptidase, partial [Saprospiraceae bacterium]